MGDLKDTVVSFKTKSVLKKKIHSIAKKENRSMTGQIEVFLYEKIKDYEKKHGKL
tara:strand:+ start:32 stop:196 length:165 start_codon:yes stop_codon:yes gene_type:complete